ncbi:MAG: hypothetical protein HQM10_12150 [Candidatus Riflebacteria bacterium]|nr:hypothetical protein [Candidatus Riflebacteria bacterium]
MSDVITSTPSLTFLLGGFGAGKTELSLNLALKTAELKGKSSSVLVDLDIVNPFFRVRKLLDEMESYGVKVIVPEKRVRSGDIPALPAEAWGAFQDTTRWVYNDIGGGEPGLRLLGRIREESEKRHSRVLFVINPFRPGYTDIKQITENFLHLQNFSALKATHIVANPHLSDETDADVFCSGMKKVMLLSENVNIPVLFSMASEHLAEKLSSEKSNKFSDVEVFPIRRFWKTPWLFGIKKEE